MDKIPLSTRWLFQQEDYRRLQNRSFKLNTLYYKKSSSERAPPPHFSAECRFKEQQTEEQQTVELTTFRPQASSGWRNDRQFEEAHEFMNKKRDSEI